MRSFWVLESEDGDWFLGLEGGELASLIFVDMAMQFSRREDAAGFLIFIQTVGLETDTDWMIVEHIERD